MNTEPLFSNATIVAIVSAALSALVAFGVGLDPTQVAAVLGFVTVVAPFVVAYLARKHVTPVASPKDNNGSPLVPESDADVPFEPAEDVSNAETPTGL